MYQRNVWTMIIAASVNIAGRTDFTMSLLVSGLPERCERAYMAYEINAISNTASPVTSIEPDVDSGTTAVISIY